jgi:excisionase family DNA binding protein
MTVKQAAQALGVSERTIYMARRLGRLRPDLATRVRAGEMSVNKALQVAEGKTRPCTWDRLVRAWNAATDDDRARLLAEASAA